MINEVLMGPGSWDLTLKEGTPLEVRKSVPYWVPDGSDQLPLGHICVTPTRLAIQSLNRTVVVANARYSGVISQRSDRMHRFGGNGLAIWFGTQNEIGARLDNSTVRTKSWQSWVHSIFTNAAYTLGGFLGNGLTEGSYFSPFTTTYTGLGSRPDTTDDYGSTTHRVTWDTICKAINNNWRVTAKGNFESGNPAFLFNFVPEVIVTRGAGGIETGMVGLAASELDVDENFDEYVNDVEVVGKRAVAGAGGLPSASGTASTFIKGFDGSSVALRHIHQTSDATDSGVCGDQAVTYLLKFGRSQQQITCRVDTYDVRQYVEPGDNIYLFDPDCGLVDLTLDALSFRGQTINPAIVKVQGVNWPIQPGMGVYAIQTQDGTNAVVDLTDWVEYEDSDPELIIGARALTAKEVATGVRPWFI